MSPFKIILIFIISALLGFLFIPKLSVDLLPKTKLPVLTISYTIPDASPEIIERQATSPLENSLSQISQIKKIYSVSHHGKGIIEISFDPNADIAFKKFEVSSIIRQLYKKLDPELSYPTIEQHKREEKSKRPLLTYRINANLAPFQIRKTAEDIIVPKLNQKEGLSEIVIQGAQEIQLTIAFDDKKLIQAGISSQEIGAQLRIEFSTFYPGALLTSGKQRFTIKGGQSPKDLEDIRKIMIRTSSGKYIALNKLAQIYLQESKPNQYFRINGLNSVAIVVYADEGTNRLRLASEVKTDILELSRLLPPGISITEDHDDTEFLRAEIDKNILRSSLSFGFLLIFLVISYRKIQHLTILFTGIIISIGITSLVAFLINIQVHLYTIAGIAISLGITIDNSIVVLDHLRTKGNKKIVLAIIGASLTTVMALMLVLILPEEDRQNLTDFCITVAVAISCSALTAVFYTPAANALFHFYSQKRNFRLHELRRKVNMFILFHRTILFITKYRKVFVILCIFTFGLPLFLLPAKWDDHEWYNSTIGSTTYQEKIRPYTDKLFGGVLQLFIRNVYEKSGYREPQKTQLYVQAELPYGNTLSDMNHVMQGIESYLSKVDGIEKFITQVTSGQYATIVISFTKNKEKTSLPFILKGKLISRSLDWGGVQWNIYGVGQGFSNNSGEDIPNFRVEMRGYNYKQLEKYATVNRQHKVD